MATVCGSGRATIDDTSSAVAEAIGTATAQLGGAKPALAFVFVAATRDLGVALRSASSALPDTDVVGCTSYGEVSEHGETRGGVSCLLVSWGDATHRVVFAPDLFEDATGLCDVLCADLDDEIQRSAARGLTCSTTVLFGDGLSPLLEEIVTRARKEAPQGHVVVGAGAAADGGLRSTRVGVGTRAVAGASAAVHVFSKRKWGVGVRHGVRAASPRMTVTRASGNVVHEIDGRPAFDAYREHVATPLAAGAELMPLLVQNELGVFLFDELVRVRAPLSVTGDGALHCAGEVPEGSTVCVVRGTPEEMIAAAGDAAREAAAQLDGVPAVGILVFSCMCRGLCLGDRYPEEVEAIRDAFPGVPIAGFLSYGEIAQTPSRLDGYHNNTVVVVAIPG